MIETFIALLFAHALADFVFQTFWIATNKHRPLTLLLHGLLVLVTAQAALGQVAAPELLALAVAHMAVDAAKARLPDATLSGFLADQGAHLLTIAALTFYAPDLWRHGVWADQAALPHVFALLAGLILSTRAGMFAIGLLMAPLVAANPPKEGLPGGGQMIGLLERGLIFVLILAEQPAAIGFLIAAKSILRFGTVERDRTASEYVIIGTLASFGWAIVIALATLGLRDLLPPLEITPQGA